MVRIKGLAAEVNLDVTLGRSSQQDFERNTTQRAIELIPTIKDDILNAIKNIRLPSDTLYEPRSFLDFAILMALYYLELHIIERVVSGKPAYSANIEEMIKANDYSRLEIDEKVKTILKNLNTLRECRENDTEGVKDAIYTQGFADYYRKGLKVIHFGQLCQYRMYLKGLYFQST